MRTIKLITRFYGGIFVMNFLVTLSCVYLIKHFGRLAYEIVIWLFWYKIISMMTFFYTSVYYRKRELYYYQNLGVSSRMLVTTTSIVDFLIWAGFVIIQFQIGLPSSIFNCLVGGVLLVSLYLHNK